jgi:hypothetical protein
LLLSFELWHQHELGELLQEVLGLRRDAARRHRRESTYSESEYQEAKRRYEEQVRDREAAEAAATHSYVLPLTDRATLKQQYREAAQLCHPDRVAEEHREAATVAFQQLQDAYQRQDMQVVADLLGKLRRGVFVAAGTTLTTIAHLQARRDALAARHEALLQELTTLRNSEAYPLAIAGPEERESYLTEHRRALANERERLLVLLQNRTQGVPPI